MSKIGVLMVQFMAMAFFSKRNGGVQRTWWEWATKLGEIAVPSKDAPAAVRQTFARILCGWVGPVDKALFLTGEKPPTTSEERRGMIEKFAELVNAPHARTDNKFREIVAGDPVAFCRWYGLVPLTEVSAQVGISLEDVAALAVEGTQPVGTGLNALPLNNADNYDFISGLSARDRSQSYNRANLIRAQLFELVPVPEEVDGAPLGDIAAGHDNKGKKSSKNS